MTKYGRVYKEFDPTEHSDQKIILNGQNLPQDNDYKIPLRQKRDD